MKKNQIILLLGLAGITLSASALVRNGAYVGAGIGETYTHYDFTVTNLNTGFVVKRDTDFNDLIGNVFVGYGYTCPSNFYLAGELGTNFPRRSDTLTRPGASLRSFTFSDRLRLQDYVTGDLLPGYRIAPNFLAYGRIGAAYSNISLYQPVNNAAGTQAFSGNKDIWGGRFGAGLNYGFNNNLGVGVDYYYTDYQSRTMGVSVLNNQYKQQPNANYVGASLIYSFS